MVAWQRSRITLVGQGRAGKTALANSIMGKKFVSDSESTRGIQKYDTKTAVFGSLKEGQRLVEYENPGKLFEDAVAVEIAKIRSYKPPEPASVSQDSFSDEEDSSQFDDADNVLSSTVAEERKDSFSLPEKTGIEPSSIVEAPTKPSMPDVDFDFYHKRLSENLFKEDELVISLFDFGGQAIFDVLHPLFMSKYGIYIVVFDMVSFLSKDDSISTDCKKSLKFWMNSVAIYTYNKVASVTAPVVLVGTRKDEVDRVEAHRLISESLEIMFGETAVWNHVLKSTTEMYYDPNLGGLHESKSLCFFPVNNKLSGVTVGFASEALELVTQTKSSEPQQSGDQTVLDLLNSCKQKLESSSFVRQKVKLIWIKLLDEIQKAKVFLSLEEVEKLAQQVDFPLFEVPEMLTYFCDMGILIWIDAEVLRNYVIVDPIEFFVKPATMMICKHIATKDDPTIHFENVHMECIREWPGDWFQMLEFGLVTEKLARRLLGSCTDNNHERIDSVLLLMEKFSLLFPLSFRGVKDRSEAGYYLPSLAPLHPERYCFPDVKVYKEMSERLKEKQDILKKLQRMRKIAATFYFAFTLSPDLVKLPILSAKDVASRGFLPNSLFGRFFGILIQDICESPEWKKERNFFFGFKDADTIRFLDHEIRIMYDSAHNLIRVDVTAEPSSRELYGSTVLLHDALFRKLQQIIRETMDNLLVFTLLPYPSVVSEGGDVPVLLPLSELKYIVEGRLDNIHYSKDFIGVTATGLREEYALWLQLKSIHPDKSKYANEVGLLFFRSFSSCTWSFPFC
jgi:GTPase SAR1 family protein